MRLAKERQISLIQKNANSHRMNNAPTNTLPFPRTRTSTKLTIIDPDTGHTVHGVHVLRVWRLHMMRHLTDQPATIIRNAFINDNQQPEEEQLDQEACHSDTPARSQVVATHPKRCTREEPVLDQAVNSY